MVEGPVTYGFTRHSGVCDHTYMTLEVSWDDIWTLSFGLSQFHGQGSWLVCEVALRETMEFANLVKQLLKVHPACPITKGFPPPKNRVKFSWLWWRHPNYLVHLQELALETFK